MKHIRKHAAFIPLACALLLLSGCYGGPRDRHRHWHDDRGPPPGAWQQPHGGGGGGGGGWDRPPPQRW